MKLAQDDKIRRILAVSVVLVIVCVVCLLISIRFVDKYRGIVSEKTSLERRLEDLEQGIKERDFITKELETVRYALSLEKGKISRDFSTIKEKYASLGKTIVSLGNDVSDFQRVMKFVENNPADMVIEGVDSSVEEAQLIGLRRQNNELVKELAVKTREKMILKIALESQAGRLGLSENYNPELKEILKNLVTSLQ